MHIAHRGFFNEKFKTAQTGEDPELEIRGASDSFQCLFHVRSFLIQNWRVRVRVRARGGTC